MFWVILSCLTTSVFVDKNLKSLKELKNLTIILKPKFIPALHIVATILHVDFSKRLQLSRTRLLH